MILHSPAIIPLGQKTSLFAASCKLGKAVYLAHADAPQWPEPMHRVGNLPSLQVQEGRC